MAAQGSKILSKADEDRYLTLIDEGISAADSGDLVGHDEVVAWVRSWGKPDELPEPRSLRSPPR